MSTAVKPAAGTTITLPTVQQEGGAIMTPMAMIDRALSLGATPETLGKLMDLQERWEANQAKKVFDEAMTLAQAEMRPIVVNAENDQTHSKYATYEALDSVLRPIYIKHGFSVGFDTEDSPKPDHVRVVMELSNSGHTKAYRVDMPTDGKGAKGSDVMTKTHATGAALTYGRRYLLGMGFNLTITKDTDGNSPENPGDTIDAMQARYLIDMIETASADERKILDFVKGDKIETLTVAQFKKAEGALRDFMRRNGRRK